MAFNMAVDRTSWMSRVICSSSLRKPRLRKPRRGLHLCIARVFWAWLAITALVASTLAREKSLARDYGQGLTVNVPVSEKELVQAVQDVAADGMIEGTKEYNKDEYVSGAEAVPGTSAFQKWTGDGQVFYKIRKNAIDPRNFKESGDAGILAVRYVVQHGDDKSTILKIDAVFLDDLHLKIHPSNGSVESAEYKQIQDHIASLQLKKQQAAEDVERKQHDLAAQELAQKREQEQLEAKLAQAPDESLQQHVDRLRHEVERVVGHASANLRSAPFHSALSEKSLSPGTQVVILISTRYWYGVETEGGQHGWIHRSELEPLP
jgi:hypothetical protein